MSILGYDEVFPTSPSFRDDMKCEYSTLNAYFLCIPLGPKTLKFDHAEIAKQQTCKLKLTTQVLGYIHVTLFYPIEHTCMYTIVFPVLLYTVKPSCSDELFALPRLLLQPAFCAFHIAFH